MDGLFDDIQADNEPADLFRDIQAEPEEKRGIVERATEGFKGGFGEEPVGLAPKIAPYLPEAVRPYSRILTAPYEPFVKGAEWMFRGPPAAANAVAGAMAGTAEDLGLSKAEADRLQRDLTIMGQGAMVEPGLGLAAAHPAAAEQALARAVRRPSEVPSRPMPRRERAPEPEAAPPEAPPREEAPPVRPVEEAPPAAPAEARPPGLFDDIVESAKPETKEVPTEPIKERPPVPEQERVPEAPTVEQPPDLLPEPLRAGEAPVAPEDVLPPKPPRKPLSLTEYIAANGGIEKTPDTASLDLPGYLVRKGGKSIDGFWRERLVEAGYLEGDVARDVRDWLSDALQRDQRGDPTYSIHDRDAIAQWKGYYDAVERKKQFDESRQAILGRLDQIGLRPEDISKADLDEAARRLYERREDDPIHALNDVLAESERPVVEDIEGVTPEGEPGIRPETTARLPGASAAREGLAPDRIVQSAADIERNLERQQTFRESYAEKSEQAPVIFSTSTVGEALPRLNDFVGLDPDLAGVGNAFSKRIRSVAGDTPVHVVDDATMRRFFGDDALAEPTHGAYSTRGFILINESVLNDPARLNHTLMHEGLHGAAWDAIATNANLRKAIRAIMDDMRRSGLPDETYALKSEQEFLAEVSGNTNLQRRMLETPASPSLAARMAGKGRIATLWDAFVENIRRWLGFKPNMTDMLDAALKPFDEATAQQWRMNRGLAGESGKPRPEEIARLPSRYGPGPTTRGARGAAQATEEGSGRRADIVRAIQDEMEVIKRFQQELKKRGIELSEAEDVYATEARSKGIVPYRQEQFRKNELDPLIREMSSRDLDVKEVGEWLKARNAPYRNRRIKRIDPNNDAGSGMTDVQAQAILQRVAQSNRAADFEQIGKMTDALQRETLESQFRDGLLTRKEINDYIRQEPYYVPFKSEMLESAAEYARVRSIRGREYKRALGRFTEADNPLGHMMFKREEAIARGERNKVVNAFANLVRNNPVPELWSDNIAPMERAINKETGLVELRPKAGWQHDPNVVAYKANGEQRFIRLEGDLGERIARALNGRPVNELEQIIHKAGSVTRVMARLATTWNPVFGPFNFIRDLGEAMVNISEFKGGRAALLRNLPHAFVGAFQYELGRGGGSNVLGPYARKWAGIAEEMDRQGARVRYLNLENPQVAFSRIQRELAVLEGKPTAKLAQIGRGVAHGLEFVNNIFENATRIAAYQGFRDMGMSPKRAAFEARELTLNFTRHGELGPVINAAYMFSNANIQGTARAVRALKTPGVQKAIATAAGLTGGLAFYNILAGGNDKDGRSFYSKVPEWERTQNFIFMYPDGTGRYHKLPAPFGYGVIKNMIELPILYGMDKHQKARELIGTMLDAASDAFVPFGSDKDWLVKLTPSIAKPYAQYKLDKSFTGVHINPWWYTDAKQYVPGYKQTFRNANPLAVGAAKWLSDITGGTDKAPGEIDVRPGTLEHITRAVTGGLGRTVLDIYQTGKRGVEGAEFLPEKAPMLRRFYGEVGFKADESLYYKEREEVRKAKTQDLPGAEKSANRIFNSADKEIKRINSQMDKVRQDATLSANKRDQELKNLENSKRVHMNAARKELEVLRQGGQPKGMATGGTVKRSKYSVDYGPSKGMHDHCGICVHFQKPRSCTEVRGAISPSAWCRLFKEKSRK